MATWIGHLRIAENLLYRIDGLHAAQFAIGNLAPDSGIPMDANREKFDPPKEVTHFLQEGGDTEGDIHDLIFFRNYLAGLNMLEDNSRFSFRLGFFFHLLVDILWAQRVWRPTRDRFREEIDKEKERMAGEIKGDWYGLDFLYVRSHPSSLFWRVFLDAKPLAADLDFLPVEALNQQLAYIKDYYQRRDEEIETMINVPYIYLSEAGMDRFVEEAAADLYHIYCLLWQEGVDTSSHKSALGLLSQPLPPVT
ncbi:MAG TPA: hypothetical protein VGJ22_02190 [Anaerolineales bacterium]|jgi:hypothetical protein